MAIAAGSSGLMAWMYLGKSSSEDDGDGAQHVKRASEWPTNHLMLQHPFAR